MMRQLLVLLVMHFRRYHLKFYLEVIEKGEKLVKLMLMNSFAHRVGQSGMVGGQAIDIDESKDDLNVKEL